MAQKGKPKDRKVLEARYRAPSMAQRDVKRARIVLLAAAGRSTRLAAYDIACNVYDVINGNKTKPS